MRVVIAARKSDLAKIQAYHVGDSLKKKHPELEVQYHFRESLGDINAHDPLWKMPEKGVFTEDFHHGLIKGDWDMVVHSWKDLPVEDKPETVLQATLPREDQRDLLLFKKKSLPLKTPLQILSSSPRRAYNLHRTLPLLLPGDGSSRVQFEPVRGNIQTRVRKLLEGSADGLIVAKAALDRLLSAPQIEFSATRQFLRQSLSQLEWMVLPLSLNPTAAAQGALAIEICRDREDLKKLLSSIHHEETFVAAQKERVQLKAWGGGCHQKIGISVLPRPYGWITWARGERDTGEIIHIETLQAGEKKPEDSLLHNTLSYKPGDFFPKSPFSAPKWFDRVAVTPPAVPAAVNAHWVSKAEALPKEFKASAGQVMWTGGLKTWEDLARRGLWVHGSAESLGEQEDERIARLADQPLQWAKWTHAEGVPDEAGKKILLANYKLEPRTETVDLPPTAEHFYWMSGSSFLQALQLHPWLQDKTHWSGPGHTHNIIAKTLKESTGQGAAQVALNFEEWQKKIKR